MFTALTKLISDQKRGPSQEILADRGGGGILNHETVLLCALNWLHKEIWEMNKKFTLHLFQQPHSKQPASITPCQHRTAKMLDCLLFLSYHQLGFEFSHRLWCPAKNMHWHPTVNELNSPGSPQKDPGICSLINMGRIHLLVLPSSQN